MLEFWKWFFELPTRIQFMIALVPFGIVYIYLAYREIKNIP